MFTRKPVFPRDSLLVCLPFKDHLKLKYSAQFCRSSRMSAKKQRNKETVDAAKRILSEALSNESVREMILNSLEESDILKLVESNGHSPRKQITAREAARMLSYNPRYFSRMARKWGLTKIKMSRTSARYYLDEVEQLAESRCLKSNTIL